MKDLLLIFCLLISVVKLSLAQNIGFNNPAPDPSALLDMVSTDKGILIPRMTSAQRTAIVAPATGLLVYDMSLSKFYFYNGAIWSPVNGNAGWSLTGDAGTSPATNFIGTTDAQSLQIKVNNVKSGFIDYADSTYKGRNTFLGKSAGLSNTTGYDNTYIGTKAGLANTGGTLNTAIGAKALQNAVATFSNVAVGLEAMQLNISGSQNTAVGTGALQNTTNGFWNNAFGYHAIRLTTNAGTGNNAFGTEALMNNTASYNSAFGHNSLKTNTTGSLNTALGSATLVNNISGNYNVAVGDNSLAGNTMGTTNTAIGYRAANSGTVSNRIVAVGDSALFYNISSDNVAVGSRAMKNNTNGISNTAIGFESMIKNTTGNYNTAVGYNSLAANLNGFNNVAVGLNTLTLCSAGSQNTVLGNYCGDKHPSYSGCTFIGYQADVNGNNYSNSTALGNQATATASNQVKLGNAAVTAIGGAVNWSIISDGRFKVNINQNVPGLAFINQLKPVTYNYDIKSYNRHVLIDTANMNYDSNSIEQKEKIVYSGFIAQDVELAAKKLNYDFSGVQSPQNDKDTYTLSYAEFVVPLVKAVQELSKENEVLKMQNTGLKKSIEEINSRLSLLQSNANQSLVK